jgi:FlaA1/EpsC-like NDP-sugar epimerase
MNVLKLLRKIDVHLNDGLDVLSACRKAWISGKNITISLRILGISEMIVVGRTSSFGQKFISMALAKRRPKKISAFSRDKIKRWDTHNITTTTGTHFLISDVQNRLYCALDRVDFIVKAAATKIVPTDEYDPLEWINIR